MLMIKGTAGIVRKICIKAAFGASIIISVFLSESIATALQTICYPEYKVCIKYNNHENIEFALNAIKKAYAFFINIGYFDTYFFEIVFQKAVMAETGANDSIRVYGKLGKDNRIYLTDWNEPWMAGQSSYGLRMSKEFYESLIVHEVAHFISEKIVGHKIETALSEYVAYVVQLSQVGPAIRNKILSKHPLPSFDSDEIHLDVMLLDPMAFAVKSYLHFMQNRGRLLKKILSDDIAQPDVAFWNFH